jgi:hypothetical protein
VIPGVKILGLGGRGGEGGKVGFMLLTFKLLKFKLDSKVSLIVMKDFISVKFLTIQNHNQIKALILKHHT